MKRRATMSASGVVAKMVMMPGQPAIRRRHAVLRAPRRSQSGPAATRVAMVRETAQAPEIEMWYARGRGRRPRACDGGTASAPPGRTPRRSREERDGRAPEGCAGGNTPVVRGSNGDEAWGGSRRAARRALVGAAAQARRVRGRARARRPRVVAAAAHRACAAGRRAELRRAADLGLVLLVDRDDERAAEDVGRVVSSDRTARERLVDVGDLLLERGDLLSVGLRERRASALVAARGRDAAARVGAWDV